MVNDGDVADEKSRTFYSNRDVDDAYFRDRSQNPYRSTIHMHRFAERLGYFDSTTQNPLVLDLACGSGSDAAYLARELPNWQVLGIDHQPYLIETAVDRYGTIPNLTFRVGDLFRFPYGASNRVPTLVWFSQSLMLFDDWRAVLSSIAATRSLRIVFSTLGWAGPIESLVKHRFVEGPNEGIEVNYNVVSTRAVASFMSQIGYATDGIEAFEIDVDLDPPFEPTLGSFTLQTDSGRRITFSAWQSMPWHFFGFSLSC